MSVEVAAPDRWRLIARRIRRVLTRALRRLHAPAAEVSVALVSARRAATLNARYRRRPAAPNVLAFPFGIKGNGEIVLCPPIAAPEAARFDRTAAQHLDALAVHGLLHLFGYSHVRPADQRRMERLERRLLSP